MADGARIQEVSTDGSPPSAGLEKGDVITKVDDTLITDADCLVATVRSYRPGDEVTVTYARRRRQPRWTRSRVDSWTPTPRPALLELPQPPTGTERSLTPTISRRCRCQRQSGVRWSRRRLATFSPSRAGGRGARGAPASPTGRPAGLVDGRGEVGVGDHLALVERDGVVLRRPCRAIVLAPRAPPRCRPLRLDLEVTMGASVRGSRSARPTRQEVVGHRPRPQVTPWAPPPPREPVVEQSSSWMRELALHLRSASS